jgi:hypothetical protein
MTLIVNLDLEMNKHFDNMISSVSKLILRRFSSEAVKKYTLPELTYGYAALEPVISGKLLEIHHKKHHNTYVTNLNNAL